MSAVENAKAALQYALGQLEYCVDAPVGPYTARTDRELAPKPPLPTLGPAGASYTDAVFGRRILRVTDGVLRPGRSYTVPSNTHLAAWSADSQQFVVMGPDGPERYAYDPDTFATMRLALVSSQCEPTWSRRVPGTVYTVAGPQTRTLFRDGVPILDLDALGIPGLVEPRTYVGAIVAAGDPEFVAVMFGGTGQDHHYLVSLVTPEGAELKRLNTRTRLGIDLHSIGADLSGRFVTLYPVGGHPSNCIVWDVRADTCTVVTVSPWGHDALGYGVQTNADVASGPWDARQWCCRSLSDLAHPSNLIPDVLTPKEIYTADHQSWNNATPDALVPMLSSTYRSAAGAKDPWRVWVGEILGVSTDGLGTVYRFAHNRHDTDEPKWSQPIAHISPDGKAAIFTSNMEQSLGLDTHEGGHRSDVFVVELT